MKDLILPRFHLPLVNTRWHIVSYCSFYCQLLFRIIILDLIYPPKKLKILKNGFRLSRFWFNDGLWLGI